MLIHSFGGRFPGVLFLVLLNPWAVGLPVEHWKDLVLVDLWNSLPLLMLPVCEPPVAVGYTEEWGKCYFILILTFPKLSLPNVFNFQKISHALWQGQRNTYFLAGIRVGRNI